MAVALEFIDFVVPIAVIRLKYPGGWEKCLWDHRELIGRRVWYDDHLFRDGAMNPLDMRSLGSLWERLGFQAMETRDGRECWKDFCVVEGMYGGSTLTCDWIEVDRRQRLAYLKGTEPGPVAGRTVFEET